MIQYYDLLANSWSLRISPVIIADRSEEAITIDSENIAIAYTVSTSQLNMVGWKVRSG